MTTHLIRTPQRLRTNGGPIITIWCSREEESAKDNVTSLMLQVTCQHCLHEMDQTFRALTVWNEVRSTSPGTIKGG